MFRQDELSVQYKKKRRIIRSAARIIPQDESAVRQIIRPNESSVWYKYKRLNKGKRTDHPSKQILPTMVRLSRQTTVMIVRPDRLSAFLSVFILETTELSDELPFFAQVRPR